MSPQVPADDASPGAPGHDLAEIAALLHNVLQEVYGADVTQECLADAFYYLNRVRRLFTSRHGIRTGLFYLVETFWKGRGFLTGHVSPARCVWICPMNGATPPPGKPAKAALLPC